MAEVDELETESQRVSEEDLVSDDEPKPTLAYRLGVWVANVAAGVFAVFAVGLVLAVLAGAAFAVFEAFPTAEEVDPGPDAGWVETIFASRSVVFATRVVLMVAAVVLGFVALLVVATVVVRISRGQWLRRLWLFEFEISEAKTAVGEEVEWAYDTLAETLERNEELERLLEERDEQLAQASAALDTFYTAEAGRTTEEEPP